MSYQNPEAVLFPQGLYEESSTALVRVGSIRRLDDGRAYCYAKAGAVALAAGKLTQAAAPVANHLNISVAAAAAIGDTRVRVTLGATAATANYYKDGFLHVNDEVGEGHLYKIRGHAAIAASGTGYIELADKIRVALTTASQVTLTANPQSGVIVLPTTATSVPVGIPPIVVTANYYFWNQVKGPAVCLIDGTVVIGQHVRLSDGVAGAVEPLDRDGTAEDEACVGTVLQVNATTEYGLIMLDIPGY
jgi:hypothetical protein